MAKNIQVGVNIIAETPRLILREIVPSDAQDLFVLDSNEQVNKYLGNNPVVSVNQSTEIIKRIRNQYDENGFGRLAVVLKDTSEFIGWSGLKLEKDIMPYAYIDLGYRFIPKFWNNGYGYESAVASLDYGFNDLGHEVINAAAQIGNNGSNKLLQKVHMDLLNTFEFEGSQHNWYEIKKESWLQTKY